MFFAACRQGLRVRQQLPSLMAPRDMAVRRLNLHEYQSMALFDKFGVQHMKGQVAFTECEAEAAATALGGTDVVVKAQVLAGGRGKGKFTSGLQGGVQMSNSPLEARALAGKMIGNSLVTKQTGAEGKPCSAVLVTERLYLRRETYFAIMMDRGYGGPVIVASPMGGMDIEAVAADTPDKIFKLAVNINDGVNEAELRTMAKQLSFDNEETIGQAVTIMKNLYELFIKSDCTLVEINPLAETHDGRVLALDAKLNFDDNAEFRQKDIFAQKDKSQEDPREVIADDLGLNYVGLDGEIGCLVNGAGLAMATMDAIKLNGGNPANFLDMGGGANAEQVTAACKLLDDDPQVKAILINIFGGIMRCDVIALGLISAVQKLNIKKPLIVRLAGTNVDKAKQLIDDCGMRILTADDLGEAAQKAVRVAEIIKMADEAHVGVNFEIPL
jgi:succinyl-CoA synthetase beta subunit